MAPERIMAMLRAAAPDSGRPCRRCSRMPSSTRACRSPQKHVAADYQGQCALHRLLERRGDFEVTISAARLLTPLIPTGTCEGRIGEGQRIANEIAGLSYNDFRARYLLAEETGSQLTASSASQTCFPGLSCFPDRVRDAPRHDARTGRLYGLSLVKITSIDQRSDLAIRDIAFEHPETAVWMDIFDPLRA